MELNNYRITFAKKEKKYKEQLEAKEKEIVKLQTKIKVLNNQNNLLNHKNETNINSNNITIKTKANSRLYTVSKDDLENNNKYKLDEVYCLYRDNNQNNDNNNFCYKNRTMSNIKQSRNTNYFTIVNKHSNKNTMGKNFSSNSLRRNNSNSSNNNRKKSYINSSRKKKNFKQHVQPSNSSLNITNNTYNMNKNNIMINLDPKNVKMNVEKLKVQKKLDEYQKLINQKLNELIKGKHPNHNVKRNKKYSFHIRRNSSPNMYINNSSQRKHNKSLVGLEYFLKRNKKKSITPNTKEKNILENNSNMSRKIISRSNIDSVRGRRNKRNDSKSLSMRRNKINIENIKQNFGKDTFNSKNKELNNTRSEIDSIANNAKCNLSLRKYIFAKCNNPSSNVIKN